MYQIYVKWNREFHFSPYGEPFHDLDAAIIKSNALLNMGDGASVKGVQVVNVDTGNVVAVNGRKL